MKLRNSIFFLATIFVFTLFLSFISPSVRANVTGPCANCHTMHNSQNGSELLSESQPVLLVNDCVGCHSATDNATWKDAVTGAPIVYNTAEPTFSNTLAGGNFFWVKTDDAKGHNIFPENPDSVTPAPGASTVSCGVESCHNNLYGISTSHNNRQGCTKCHMMGGPPYKFGPFPGTEPKGYHHANDSNTVMGSETDDQDGYYRFLSGHMSGSGHGVSGIENADWNHNATSASHNEYLGFAGTKTSAGNFSTLGHTMTGFCCGCHGNFHIEQDVSSIWIRHPSDAVIPITGEYASYTIYDPSAPVARPSLSGWTAPSLSVNEGGTVSKDMVMCLSCHVAHGSPYDDMLRWDYDTMNAGGGGSGGCFVCHTEKNGS